MGRKAEERERRRERNRKIIGGLSCALCLVLVADVSVFLVAALAGDTKVAVYAFFGIFFIVPPMMGCMSRNLDGPFWWPFF